MIHPWRKSSSRQAGDFRIFSVRQDFKVSPTTGREHDFFVIDSTNWVNVIALTRDRRLVMVEQYRHGSDAVELEIPGGVMDAGDPTPEATACRELREETGYAGENPRVIGRVLANAAIMSNICTTVLVENCEPAGPVEFDSTEELETRLMSIAEVTAAAAAGKIRHSLVVAALYHFEMWLRKSPQ